MVLIKFHAPYTALNIIMSFAIPYGYYIHLGINIVCVCVCEFVSHIENENTLFWDLDNKSGSFTQSSIAKYPI